MSGSTLRSRAARVLRPTVEAILLVASVVVGLGIVGSCVSAGSGAGTTGAAMNIIAGAVFAIVLVGAVFLFTTMSRDLRLLRERYTENGGPGTSGSPLDDRDTHGPTGTSV